MSQIWIVRHGNTFEDGELPRRIGSPTDIPLVESGRRQGEALGRWFTTMSLSFDRILTGPLQRTRETAALIAPAQSPEPCDWLTEIDHGPDENKVEADVVARIGADAIDAWDHHAASPPGWRVDMDLRVAGWRKLLAETEPDQNVLAVTSNGAARFVLMAGVAQGTMGASLKLRTGSWGLIARSSAGEWRTIAWDRRP